MTVDLKNSTGSREPPAAPVKPDGTPYRFEMIHAGGRRRCYADTHLELVAVLIPGYDELDGHGRSRARLRYCVDVQVRLQAALATPELLDACTAEQRAVVLGGRDAPPSPAVWSAPVPLALVTAFYVPIGPRPRPEADGAGELVWLDPTSDLALLTSLHVAGVMDLAVRESEVQQVEGA
ncbi:hypothetical protein [Flindersiella endophytica]